MLSSSFKQLQLIKHFAPEGGEGVPMGQLCLQSLGVLVPAGEGEKWLSIGRCLGEKLLPRPSHLPGICPRDDWHTGLMTGIQASRQHCCSACMQDPAMQG